MNLLLVSGSAFVYTKKFRFPSTCNLIRVFSWDIKMSWSGEGVRFRILAQYGISQKKTIIFDCQIMVNGK